MDLSDRSRQRILGLLDALVEVGGLAGERRDEALRVGELSLDLGAVGTVYGAVDVDPEV